MTDWLDAALSDYAARRAEILALMSAQQQTLTFGGATIGILTAGAANVWSKPAIAAIVFIVVIPLVAVTVGTQWVGQSLSLMRLGVYLRQLESELRKPGVFDSPLPRPFFTWEESYAFGRRATRYSGLLASAAVVVLALLAIASIMLGAYRGWHSAHASAAEHAWLLLGVAAELLLFAAWGTFLGLQLARGRGSFAPNAAEPDRGGAAGVVGD